MDVNILTFRIRIGSFNASSYQNRRTKNLDKKSYKSKKGTSSKLRRLANCLLLFISILSRLEECTEHPGPEPYYQGCLAVPVLSPPRTSGISELYSPLKTSSLIDGPEPVELSLHGVHVQPVHLGTGWGVAALLQYSKDNNFYARYTNGNRTNRGMKLSHWNAGNAFLENKVINIENVIADHHPHLIGISEANLHKTHCIDNCKIPNYDIFTSKTLGNKKLQVSRVVVYKHTSLVAKVREDLMCDSFSSIWLEVGLPGKNRILVCNLYRDWQYLGQGDNSSLEIPEQLARWITFLDQWERAL